MSNVNVVEKKWKDGVVTEYWVYPTGNPNTDTDFNNVRDAIEDVADGGTVILKANALGSKNSIAGPVAFQFGGDDTGLTKQISLTHNVMIRGEVDEREEVIRPGGYSTLHVGVKKGKGTTIVGGRMYFQWKTQVSVSVSDIRFEGFFHGVFGVHATTGHTEISGCSFINYEAGSYTGASASQTKGAFPIVAFNQAAPDSLTGTMTIADNFFGEPKSSMTQDTNNLIHLSDCSFKPLKIVRNHIEDMRWCGIAVYSNKGSTIIKENDIRKMSSYAKVIPSSNSSPEIINNEGAGIAVGVRAFFLANAACDGDFTIERNTITVGSPNSHGILVFLFSPQKYTPPATNVPSIQVQNNYIDMVEQANQDAVHVRAALACGGATWWCSKTKWKNNKITGKARYGIWVSDRVPGFVRKVSEDDVALDLSVKPTPMEISGNNLTQFTATRAQVFVGKAVRGVKLSGNNKFGKVEGGNTQNPYTLQDGLVEPNEPFPATEAVGLDTDKVSNDWTSKAGIWWRGDDGELDSNDFTNSGLMGWDKAPFVGGIYLDKESCENKINWSSGKFPSGSGTLPTAQIYSRPQSKAVGCAKDNKV